MKDLILKLILFILPIILIGAGMEILLRKIPNDYLYKKIQLEKHANTVETLILGGSHAYYGIIPDYLESNSFNLAYDSQFLNFDRILLKKYIDSLPNIKNVIIMIAYPTLSHRYNEGDEVYRKFNYFRYYDLDPPPKNWYQKYYFELFRLPFKKNFQRIISYLRGEEMIHSTVKGWCLEGKKEISKNLEQSALHTAKLLENNSMDFTPGLRELNDIFFMCEQRKVKVYLITFPTWEGFRELINMKKFDKMIETCETLADQNKNVEYYNFTDDSRFTREDYYDSDHLNDEGARKFTLIINELIKEK